MFYSIVLYFIHTCIDIFLFLRLLYRDLQRCVRRWFNFLGRLLPLNELDGQVRLKKLPLHLGVIIREDRICFNDLSNIINWSLCQGIHHVSIYDDRGYIKANGKMLYTEATLKKDIYLKKRSQNFNLIFSDGKSPYSYNIIIKNGHTTADLRVYLLSHENGKQYIVNAAKNFCKDVTQNPASLQNFHSREFESYIKDILDIPDPQLIIKFGKVGGLIGYLPWHVRLSEILSYPTHHNLQFKQFREFLLRYSRCEQRFGT